MYLLNSNKTSIYYIYYIIYNIYIYTSFNFIREISCLEFLYLRVLTGCVDGKIRVWNILNGQCLRIMRGNSKSDAIFRMTATENR